MIAAAVIPAALFDLTAAQQQAALCADAPVLVVAGPGSGKTRTLVARLTHLLHSGAAKPSELCAITFTRKAAGELRERLQHRLGPQARQLTIGTFHQLCLRLRPLPPGVTLIREPDRLTILAHVLRDHARTASGQPVSATTLRRMMRRLAEALSLAKGRSCDGLLTIGSAPSDPPWLRPAALSYCDWLTALGLEDLDDLLLAATLACRKRLAEKATAVSPYRYIHVDEYQDVSGVQRELLQALAEGGAQIFAIGDPDQSIYAFRGANLDNFYSFASDFAAARVFFLRDNFRATATLVAASSALIAHAPDRSQASLPPSPPPQATRPDGERIELLSAQSPLSEAIAIARQIERLIGGTSLTSHDQGRATAWAASRYGFSDIAVLTRTVARADEVATALQREGIPTLRPRRARPADDSSAETEPSPLASALQACPTSAADRAESAALQQARHALSATDSDEIGEPHESDEWDARMQRVAVLTLHGSKGLEFPVVFLCGCEAEQLPGRAESPAEIAEERRLLYVGMTRAKDLLWLSHAGLRPRSPFIDELPASLLHESQPRPPARPKPPQLKLF